MKVKVTKVNGNNNNFVLLFKNILPDNLLLKKNKIIQLCNNDKVDGLLYLEYFNQNKVNLDYYNNDGTWETLCVNGLRCASLFLYEKYDIKKYTITCGDGIHKTKIMNNLISVHMPEPKYVNRKVSIGNITGNYIDSGAKHFVINIGSSFPSKNILKDIAKKIRFNKSLFPNGININFYKIIDKETIKVITYEKGIEDIVESCASGSFACAYHLCKKMNFLKDITVLNNGGKLFIKFNKNFSENSITAKAKIEKEYFIDIPN